MSKKGKDFKGGGFYAINKNKVDVEKYIDVGDIGIGFATIIHGVAPDKKVIQTGMILTTVDGFIHFILIKVMK